MQIVAPFGYKEIAPLYKTQKVLLPKAGEIPAFCRSLNALPISYAEFGVASRDYPIVFASGDEGKSYAPVIVVGMVGGENLFIDGTAWDPSVYIPAYVRRYPFCMSRVTIDAVEQDQRLTCVEKEFLSDKGELLFDAKGEALPHWKPIERLLSEYEADLDRSREMSSILADYALLEPFSMQATLNAGGSMNLTGMFRIDERKLEFLTATQLKNLVKKGVMGRIYVHLLSLDNFGRMLDRKAARSKN
jgi:SapC protein